MSIQKEELQLHTSTAYEVSGKVDFLDGQGFWFLLLEAALDAKPLCPCRWVAGASTTRGFLGIVAP